MASPGRFQDLAGPQTVSAVAGEERGAREDFEQLRSSARAVGECAMEFERAFRRLLPTLGDQNPWGADEPGTIFGMAYAALIGQATEVLGSHVDLLYAGEDGLADWSASSEQAEDDGEQHLNMVGQDLER